MEHINWYIYDHSKPIIFVKFWKWVTLFLRYLYSTLNIFNNHWSNQSSYFQKTETKDSRKEDGNYRSIENITNIAL